MCRFEASGEFGDEARVEKTVGMKILLAKTCGIMTMVTVMLLGCWYWPTGTYREVENSPQDCSELFPARLANLGLGTSPLPQQKWPFLTPVRPRERYSSVGKEEDSPLRPCQAVVKPIISFQWGQTGAQMG